MAFLVDSGWNCLLLVEFLLPVRQTSIFDGVARLSVGDRNRVARLIRAHLGGARNISR